MAKRRRGRAGKRYSKKYKTKKLKVSSGRTPGRIGFRLS